jgi:peptidoglycan hydrolase-like protein with peptidoglycan-binding domain
MTARQALVYLEVWPWMRYHSPSAMVISFRKRIDKPARRTNMATYHLGSAGPEVRQIQTALQQRGAYQGPIDGLFGGGTEAAVRQLQTQSKVAVDGIVGQVTWAILFGATAPPIPAPTQVSRPLNERCLALTASFETGTPPPDCYAGVAGNFDKMGLSFGAMQWNLGQQSLQPLLREFDTNNQGVVDSIFGSKAEELRSVLAAPLQDQLDWALSIQTSRFVLIEPWLGYFKTLGRTQAFIDIEVAAVNGLIERARRLCATYNVGSQRALALMFDIITQNGGISAPVTASINQDIKELSGQLSASDAEVAKLRIIANRRADAATAQWREDVRTRKLTIANGSGTVHGRSYNLADQYGIDLSAMGAP